jgi:hypothetical protein
LWIITFFPYQKNHNDFKDKDANKHDGLPRQDSSNEGKREENVVAAANHKQADDKPTGLFKLNIANPAQRIKAHLFQKAMELQKKKVQYLRMVKGKRMIQKEFILERGNHQSRRAEAAAAGARSQQSGYKHVHREVEVTGPRGRD